jgi:peptidoglycan hydrolase-like protein with peptidoglycan-binding domain
MPLLEVGSTGVFGSQARGSVEAFQAWGGVATDGIVGDRSWSVFLHAASATRESQVGLEFVIGRRGQAGFFRPRPNKRASSGRGERRAARSTPPVNEGGQSMGRFRLRRPTPSMLVACAALAVALGGTGYAAVSLPANSVGTVQVKNHSLRPVDLAPGVIRPGPRGPAGPQGAAGPTGPAGPAGPTARWALVRGDGTIVSQSGGISPTSKPATGVYILDFGSAVNGKLIIASSANTGDVGDRGTVSAGSCGGTPEGSTCPAGNDTNHVRVITRAAGDNVAADHPFYIAVVG